MKLLARRAVTYLPWVLCLIAAPCSARAQEAGGVSYRDAYRAMVTFAKYGKPKNFLQYHFQVAPKDGNRPLDGLRLTLSGKTTQLNLPLDATGRASLPLLKAAYDENAMLVLNREADLYTFQPRLSIAARVDGIYDGADLRAACDQALQYQRDTATADNGGYCAGVRFVFLPTSDAAVRIRDLLKETTLPAGTGAAFDGDANTNFRLIAYRFAEWPDKVQITAPSAPVAIVAIIE